MKGTILLEEDGRTVLIKDLSIQDEILYQFLQEVDEDKRLDRLVSAVRIGAIGLRRIAMGEEMDFVEKGFNSLLSKFEKMFDPSLETSHLGKLARLLKEYFDRGGTVENMLDPTVENTPLGKLRLEILREIKELRESITKKEAKEEVIDITTLKGYEFEDACEEILSEFVSKHIGDELERKTKEVGEIAGSFAGDFVITLREFPDRKIVLETKDWDSVTLPQILKNLENAMANRGARYSIFVSKFKEALPKKIGWFNEFRGNMLVCALGSKEADTFFPEILNIAYQWAKLRVEREVTIEEKALETVAKGIGEIETKLDALSQIQRQCTNVEKATEEIRTLSNNLKDGIKEEINKIQRAMEAVAEEE
jgi:hypothetical protein